MTELMSKPKKQSVKKSDKDKPTTVFFRLDEPTEAALASFIRSQPVPPSIPSVAFQALHDFLVKHGHWPPKKP